MESLQPPVKSPQPARRKDFDACFHRGMCIFVFGMKKVLIIVAYWLSAIILTALLLTSLDYDLWQAVLLSLSFLPAAMALSFFLPKVERDSQGKKRVLDTIYIILGVMLMTFFLIYLWQWLFISLNELEGWKVWSIPAMLGNPVSLPYLFPPQTVSVRIDYTCRNRCLATHRGSF